MTIVMNNNANESEEFFTIPPTNVIDAEGMKKIAEVEANDEAQRVMKYQEIRFKDGDMKIVRVDPTKTDYVEDTITMEGEPPKKIWRYHFMASEYMMGKWTKFKVMKIAPMWGRSIVENMKEGNLTFKITRDGAGLTTKYHITITNVKQ